RGPRRRQRGETGRIRLLLRQDLLGREARSGPRDSRQPQRRPRAIGRGGHAPGPLSARRARTAAMRRTDRRLVLLLGLLAVALPASLAVGQGPAFVPGPATSGDFAGRVALPDGRGLYLECRGSGSPTVIFEAGLRGRGDSWTYSRISGAG